MSSGPGVTSGADPWALAAQLQAGDPAQVESMASGWSRAGDLAREATATSRTASSTTGAAAILDGAPGHAAPAATGLTAGQLGNGGEDLDAVAEAARAAGVSLAENTASATEEIERLEEAIAAAAAAANGQLAANAAAANAQLAAATVVAGPAIIAAARIAEGAIIGAAEAEIEERKRAAAAAIQGFIDQYEGVLNTGLRVLSGLGFLPPLPSGSEDQPPTQPSGNVDWTMTNAPLEIPNPIGDFLNTLDVAGQYAGNIVANLGDIAGDASTALGLISAVSDFAPGVGQAVDIASLTLAGAALTGHGVGDLLGAEIPPETYAIDVAAIGAGAIGLVPIPGLRQAVDLGPGDIANAGLFGGQLGLEAAGGDDITTIVDNLPYYVPDSPFERGLALSGPHGAGLVPIWNAVETGIQETNDAIAADPQGQADRRAGAAAAGRAIEDAIGDVGRPMTLPR